jgi:hypothetical protein
VRAAPPDSRSHSTLQDLYEVTRHNLAEDGQIAGDGVGKVNTALSERGAEGAGDAVRAPIAHSHLLALADAVSLRDLGLNPGLAEVGPDFVSGGGRARVGREGGRREGEERAC